MKHEIVRIVFKGKRKGFRLVEYALEYQDGAALRLTVTLSFLEACYLREGESSMELPRLILSYEAETLRWFARAECSPYEGFPTDAVPLLADFVPESELNQALAYHLVAQLEAAVEAEIGLAVAVH